MKKESKKLRFFYKYQIVDKCNVIYDRGEADVVDPMGRRPRSFRAAREIVEEGIKKNQNFKHWTSVNDYIPDCRKVLVEICAAEE